MIHLALWIASALFLGFIGLLLLYFAISMFQQFGALSTREQFKFALTILGFAALMCFGWWGYSH